MINELYSVYQGLKDVGEEPEAKHNDIASPGMGTTFRVCLSENGNVTSVELLTRQEIKDTWSLGNGNKNQFPAAKFEHPFMPDGHGAYQRWKDDNSNPNAKSYREMLSDIFAQYSISLPDIVCWPQYRDKILERKEKLRDPLNEIENGSHLYELFDRYSKAENEGAAILGQVAEKLKEMVFAESDKETLKAISGTLFGESFDNTGKKLNENSRPTFLIDCLPEQDVDVYASSRSRVPVLSEALFATEKNAKRRMGTCALTGDNTELLRKKFPSEKLNIVGSTILLAKSASTSGPTVKRYDKSGTDSFFLGKSVGEKLAAAIVFLTSDRLENKTWTKIPSSVGSSPSLLLAYCKSHFDLQITPAITGGEIDDFDDYENATETVLELFKKSNCTPDDAVEICEIRVLDKANRKVNYSTTSSVGEVSSAANDWIRACKNVPDFKLLVKIERENKLISPWTIAPIQTISLTKNKYIRDGLSSTPVSSLSFADTMTLFISRADNVKQLSVRAIEKLVNQVEPLLRYCALSKNQRQLKKKNQRVITRTDKNNVALKTATFLCVLLFKAGRKKEDFMSSFAYQLGQLCSAMDELHIGYCQSIRGGDIPSSLIGNTAYNIALQSPVKSLALLASRIRPYKAWAKKTRAKNKADDTKTENKGILAGLAASVWLEKHASIIEEHFSDHSQQMVNDTYKAEVMLGYLAGRPFNEKNTNSNKKGAEQ